ncbi:MAG: hypothetical protein LDL47_05155 [Cyanobacteria bacterium KgW148]|nr:hypothetical protein [Cyanobacteria bacterium KgW148]
MPEESIEDILSALRPKDSGLDKLIEGLEQSSRSVGHSLGVEQKTEIMTSPVVNKDRFLDKILEDIAQGETTPLEEAKQPSIVRKDDTPEELKTIAKDLIKQKTDRAKEWLKELDPLSSEGLWFKEFAKHYPSELEAALDYLQ